MMKSIVKGINLKIILDHVKDIQGTEHVILYKKAKIIRKTSLC